MEKINSELKDLCLEIIQSNNNSTEEWLKKTASIYEKLLVLDYLDQRDKQLKGIEKKVKKQLKDLTQHKTPKVGAPKKGLVDSNQTEMPLNQEVKILPHPEGPPRPIQKDIEESIIEIQKEENQKSNTPKAEEPKKEKAAVKEVVAEPKKEEIETEIETETETDKKQSIAERAESSSSKKSLNDKLVGSIKIGLNDRLAFVKHLFNGQQEDFNRVLSQLNSFNNLEDAEQFIIHIVKPEYHWNSKEEYEERFMELIRNKY